MSSTDIDISQSISDLLRIGTQLAHEKAEHSEGAGWLVRGELAREEYVRFLMMLYHVYDVLEKGLDKYASHPVLAPTFNPTLFARTATLSADISYFLQVPEASWQTHPIHVELASSPPGPYKDYTSRLQKLSDSDPARLLAHAYVRYLGDLSGGQYIKRRLVKAYGLEDEGGAGVSFYDFKQLGGSASSTIGDMKKIKEWYRAGMNEGVGDDVALKAAVLDEANIAFELNTNLFSTLRPPSRPLTPESPVPAVLGDPTSPVVESAFPLLHSKSEVVYEADEKTVAAPRTFPLSSVIAFILALCLSHFILVIGGFTGEKGYAKLESVLHSITALFSASS